MPKEQFLTREALWKSYVEEERTQADIAQEAEIAPQRVHDYLKKHSIPIRQRVQNPLLTKEALHKSYVEDNRTPTDIAREAGISPPGIYEYLRRYGIPIHDRPVMTEEYLRQTYIDERKTLEEIASIVGVAVKTVSYWLKEYGIQTRSVSDYAVTVDRDWLIQQHDVVGRSWLDIRTELGLPSNTFFNMLVRLNVPLTNGTKGNRTIKVNYRLQSEKFTTAERRAILKRDSHRCQMPGCRSRADATLEVHHIVSIYDGGATTMDNAITLCRTHHLSIRSIERNYIELFLEVVKHNSQEA